MRTLNLAFPLLVAFAAVSLPAAAAPSTPPIVTATNGSFSPAPSPAAGEAAIEETVLRALVERRFASAGTGIQLTAFSARLPLTIVGLTVERISYQPAGARFIAVLATPGDEGVRQRFTVAGRLLSAVEIPVPARRLQAGETIGPEDLQWVSLRNRSVPANAVQRPDDLIGRVARRNLAAGAPVTAADLKRNAVIAKGSAVTLILEVPNMQLTARGRALDEGAAGDTIRVANLQSKSIVIGVVTPEGQVSVGDADPTMGAAAGRHGLR